MNYIVRFEGSMSVKADNEDDALYTLGQLTGDELLDAIDTTHAEIDENQEIQPSYSAEDYV
jgi:hypothetical protein